MTRDEEHAYAAIDYHQNKNREAHQLVTGNLRFVVNRLWEYVHCVKLLDLIQDGNMGLVKAVQNLILTKVRLTTRRLVSRSYIQKRFCEITVS